MTQDNRPQGQQIGNTESCRDTFTKTAERQVSNAMVLIGKAVIDRDKATAESLKLREAMGDISKIMSRLGGPLNDNKYQYDASQIRIFHEIQEMIDNAIGPEE